MNSYQQFLRRFKSVCLAKQVPYEVVCEEANFYGVLVLKQYKDKCQNIIKSLNESSHDLNIHIKPRISNTGIVFAISPRTIMNEDLASLAFDADAKYSKFYSELDLAIFSPIDESQYKSPVSAHEKASATEQFPDRITGKEVKKRKKKTVSEKIEEALDGMATPDDVQPGDALKALASALKHSGLDQDLKKAGISWHVAKPGNHLITFNNGEIPILQKSTLELADSKVLGELLSALRSIADGKAPESGQIELDMVQQQAKDAREKQNQLTDIATQFVAPLEQQKAQDELKTGSAPA